MAQLVEHLTGWTCPAVDRVVRALPDCLVNIRAGRDIQQPLVGLGVLYDRLGFALDSQDHRPFAPCLRNSPELRRKAVSD